MQAQRLDIGTQNREVYQQQQRDYKLSLQEQASRLLFCKNKCIIRAGLLLQIIQWSRCVSRRIPTIEINKNQHRRFNCMWLS